MKASELKNLDVRELIDELNSLDFENVGGWPMPVKIGAAVLVFGFCIALTISPLGKIRLGGPSATPTPSIPT